MGTFDATFDTLYFVFSFGLSSGGLLNLYYGGATIATAGTPTLGGDSGGIGYRHPIDPPGAELRRGFSVTYRWGYAESYDYLAWFNRTDITVGASKLIDDKLEAYVGAALSTVDVAITDRGPPYYDYEVSATDTFGAFVGLETPLTEKSHLGIELHLLNESGFGIYVEAAF